MAEGVLPFVPPPHAASSIALAMQTTVVSLMGTSFMAIA
jgi:hypothetical protein